MRKFRHIFQDSHISQLLSALRIWCLVQWQHALHAAKANAKAPPNHQADGALIIN